MKPNRFERNYRDTVPLIDGLQREGSNKTKLSRSAGKIGLNCDYCGTSFETYAAWAKKSNNHYCSRGCYTEAQKIPVEKNCVICGETFITNPTTNKRKVTCSKKCSNEKRRRFLLAEAMQMDKSKIYNFGKHEHGEQISNKLTEENIRAIRSDSRSQKIIAIEYKTSQSNVCRIRNRKTWNHVIDTVEAVK